MTRRRPPIRLVVLLAVAGVLCLVGWLLLPPRQPPETLLRKLKDAADTLERAGIVVNKNTVPNDSRSPAETSGIRPGTPALTTRGMREQEMHHIGKLIARIIHDKGEHEEIIEEVRKEVLDLCDAFPIYHDIV